MSEQPSEQRSYGDGQMREVSLTTLSDCETSA